MNKLIVVALLSALATVAGAQSAVTDRQPLAGAILNPCTGEPVIYEGTCNYVTRESGSSQTIHANCHATGVGAFGFGEYVFGVNAMHRTETLSCGATERFSERTRLITSRSTQNAFITVTFLVTTDANCQPVVVVDQAEVECRGKTGVF